MVRRFGGLTGGRGRRLKQPPANPLPAQSRDRLCNPHPAHDPEGSSPRHGTDQRRVRSTTATTPCSPSGAKPRPSICSPGCRCSPLPHPLPESPTGIWQLRLHLAQHRPHRVPVGGNIARVGPSRSMTRRIRRRPPTLSAPIRSWSARVINCPGTPRTPPETPRGQLHEVRVTSAALGRRHHYHVYLPEGSKPGPAIRCSWSTTGPTSSDSVTSGAASTD